MKKIVSLVLCVSMLASFAVTAFASGNECNCSVNPLIFVHGFGSYPLYLNPVSEEPEQVFPPDNKSILKSVPDILGVINNLAVTENYDKCADEIMDVLDILMGKIACNDKGDPLYNVGIQKRELPTEDHHKETNYSFLVASDESNDYSQYNFYYDWRLDPMDNAESLNKYIEYIKVLTGHSKVNIACHSQGNTVVAAYLSMYKNRDVAKVVFLSPAYKGLSLVGNIFTGNVGVGDKSDALELYLTGLFGYSPSGMLGSALISMLNDYGVLPVVLTRVQDLLDNQFQRVYDEELVGLFGTMPGVWSFCPDNCYEQAKAYTLKDKEKYADLIDRIDDYHYNVQNKLESILDECVAEGMQFTILAGYGISTIPVVPGNESQSDMLIDTSYMTLGAVCANAGTTFPSNYKQAEYRNGINYVSPDMMIDASSCTYPEQTFFVRDQLHSGFSAGYTELITKLLLSKQQPTISNMKGYYQFMYNDEDGNLLPVTEPVAPQTKSDEEIIFSSVIALIKASFTK